MAAQEEAVGQVSLATQATGEMAGFMEALAAVAAQGLTTSATLALAATVHRAS